MFTMIFDSGSGKPMYRQLYEYIKNEIIVGNLKGGEKLPSKRTLASHLKISTVTVETAYEQLATEGYIYSLPKKGFYAEKGLESKTGSTASGNSVSEIHENSAKKASPMISAQAELIQAAFPFPHGQSL